MKLSNVNDEDLKKVALLKTKKGTATSDAKRAQQILYSRNVTHGGYYAGGDCNYPHSFASTLDFNITREYKTFKEVNGCTIEEWQDKERQRHRDRYLKGAK